MSVRQGLLAILAQGPCYGHQLRHEFDRRTGATRPLNVGQIYNTLERLERDGFVTRGTADAQGHIHWTITEDGAAEVGRWLSTPVDRGQVGRDELATKLAMAVTLPGVDATALIHAQRKASMRQRDELLQVRSSREDDSAEGLAWSMVVDAMVFAADAELTWLEHVESRLAGREAGAWALEPASERPKRGRPARALV